MMDPWIRKCSASHQCQQPVTTVHTDRCEPCSFCQSLAVLYTFITVSVAFYLMETTSMETNMVTVKRRKDFSAEIPGGLRDKNCKYTLACPHPVESHFTKMIKSRLKLDSENGNNPTASWNEKLESGTVPPYGKAKGKRWTRKDLRHRKVLKTSFVNCRCGLSTPGYDVLSETSIEKSDELSTEPVEEGVADTTEALCQYELDDYYDVPELEAYCEDNIPTNGRGGTSGLSVTTNVDDSEELMLESEAVGEKEAAILERGSTFARRPTEKIYPGKKGNSHVHNQSFTKRSKNTTVKSRKSILATVVASAALQKPNSAEGSDETIRKGERNQQCKSHRIYRVNNTVFLNLQGACECIHNQNSSKRKSTTPHSFNLNKISKLLEKKAGNIPDLRKEITRLLDSSDVIKKYKILSDKSGLNGKISNKRRKIITATATSTSSLEMVLFRNTGILNNEKRLKNDISVKESNKKIESSTESKLSKPRNQLSDKGKIINNITETNVRAFYGEGDGHSFHSYRGDNIKKPVRKNKKTTTNPSSDSTCPNCKNKITLPTVLQKVNQRISLIKSNPGMIGKKSQSLKGKQHPDVSKAVGRRWWKSKIGECPCESKQVSSTYETTTNSPVRKTTRKLDFPEPSEKAVDDPDSLDDDYEEEEEATEEDPVLSHRTPGYTACEKCVPRRPDEVHAKAMRLENLESVGRRIYAVAAALKEDLKKKKSDLEELERKEKTIRKGLANLRGVQRRCGSIRRAMDSARRGYLLNLRQLLGLSRARSKMERRINGKVEEILKRIQQ